MPNQYPPLLSLAVHEFRTPASVVGGYLRMLQSDQDPPMSERQQRMIDQAAQSCERLVAIVAELSEIGKLDSGDLALAQRPLDFFALIEDVASQVQEGRDRGVQLTLAGPSSGAPFTGDEARLRTAVDAVLRAILREQPGPAVIVAERRLETRDGRAYAVLVIADKGQTQIAYDGDGAFDDMRGGLGLALPLARRVIEGHGAHLGSAVIAFPL